MISQTISHYRILEKLGAGGMGEVYLAQDTKLDRTVVLKIVPADFASDRKRIQRFLQEAKAAASLSHPNVCVIHEVGETEDGRPFIAMEHVNGQTLDAKIAGASLDTGVILDIGIQISDALDEAHSKGITHRDIKPANIMYTPRGQVKVLDFGLAKMTVHVGQAGASEAATEARTESGVVIGTVEYMSPEQALGKEIDHRTDIFSLGVVLYEMATGRRPFSGISTTETIDHIIHSQPEAIARFNYNVPSELERIVRKSLEKDMERRYQSVRELAVDLRSLKRDSDPGIGEAVKRAPGIAVRYWGGGVLRRLRSIARSHPWAVGLSAPTIAAAMILVVWILGSYPTLSFAPRDWILIADFDNQTGDSVFDKSLSTAFSISLQQSAYANIYPRERVQETLKRMKKTGVEKIDESIAKEIVQREKIRALVIPSISGIDDNYRLTARIWDPVTGRDVKSGSFKARGKDKVLDALDNLAAKIRKDLGETVLAIYQSSKPLAEVTTSSLEALKQYSLAIEEHWSAQLEEAKQLYQMALQTDPTFTAAQASLGLIHFEFFDKEEGKRLLGEAAKNADDLTGVEKYRILAFYAMSVEQNQGKAIQYHKAILSLHPDNLVAHNNLGRNYMALRRYREAIAEFNECLRIEPQAMLPYNSLTEIHLYALSDVDSAIKNIERQMAINDRVPFAYEALGWAYLGKERLEQAQAAFSKVLEIDPHYRYSNRRLFLLSHTYRLNGRYGEALRPLQSILQSDPKEYIANYYMGIIFRLTGDEKQARKHFELYRKATEDSLRQNPKDALLYIDLALVLTRLGQRELGWQKGLQAMELKPHLHFSFAQLLSVLGRTEEALDRLELAIEKGYRDFIWMKIHIDLQNLYNHPRFTALLQKNIKGYAKPSIETPKPLRKN